MQDIANRFNSEGIMKVPVIDRKIKVAQAYASIDGPMSEYCRKARESDNYKMLETIIMLGYCGDILRTQECAYTIVLGDKSQINKLLHSHIIDVSELKDNFLNYTQTCIEYWRYLKRPDLTEMCITWASLLKNVLHTPDEELSNRLDAPFCNLLDYPYSDANSRKLAEEVRETWSKPLAQHR